MTCSTMGWLVDGGDVRLRGSGHCDIGVLILLKYCLQAVLVEPTKLAIPPSALLVNESTKHVGHDSSVADVVGFARGV